MSLRLWLVRHARTNRWTRGRFNGWEDVPLNERGHIEAAALRVPHRNGRESGVLISSEPARQLVWPASIPSWIRRLRELDFGSLEGMAWEELDRATQRLLVGFDDFVAPGGESVANFRARVRSFLADLTPGDHLIFTHGGVIRLLLRAAGRSEHVPPGHTAEVEVPIGSKFWGD